MYANRRTAPASSGTVRLSNEIKFGSQSRFISDPPLSVGCWSFENRMGAVEANGVDSAEWLAVSSLKPRAIILLGDHILVYSRRSLLRDERFIQLR